MQPRLAYTAAVEVPPSLCQTSKGDGSAYIPISPASRNLVEPSSTVPKSLTANEVVASSTQKSSGQSSTDIIPVYPGDPKDLSTKETTTKEGLTSQQLEASSTTHRDLIMMALPGNSETGHPKFKARVWAGEEPNAPLQPIFFFIYVAARNFSFGHFCWAILEKQLF